MAQLKSTVVQGSLRVTDTTYTTNLNLSSGTASQIVKTDANKNLITGTLSKSDVGLGNVANSTYAGGTAVTLNGTSKAASTASFYAPTTAGTSGQYLKSTGGVPEWASFSASTVGLGNVSNNANLNSTTGTKGDIIYWSAANTPAHLAIGTAGYTLQATANGPAWTQTVAVAYGGTGATQFTANSLIMSGSTTTAALTTRAITDRTSVGALTNVATWANSTNIPTVNLIAYWDGRYQTTNNASNLTYCNKGAFGNAATYGVDDATANGALGTGTGLTTERSVYYGLVTVNNASQTRATGIYAPTSAGTANQILVSAGGTSAPTWQATANGAAYATSANGALTFGTLPVVQGGTGKTTAAEAWTNLGGGDSGKHAENYYALAGHTHSEYAKIKPFSANWTSQTSIAIADPWITDGAAVVATDLQTKNLPGIVTWTITNNNITFTCTVAASPSTIGTFNFLMIKP